MAAKLGWATRRRPRGAAASDAGAAAEAIAAYLGALPEGPRRRRLPSHAELRGAGRHDLRYALQVRACARCPASCSPAAHGWAGALHWQVRGALHDHASMRCRCTGAV